jgi:hypothetical protein
MKLDTYLLLIGMVEIEHKKILVCTDQSEMTKGKNVVLSNDLCIRMIKQHRDWCVEGEHVEEAG